MDGTRETWERFYERVVVRGRGWPRSLWFAAVEDGLRAALPTHSHLLAQYRDNVAELEELERAGNGSPRDALRRQQLEAEIRRLIGVADQSIRDQGGFDRRAAGPAGQPRSTLWLAAVTLGVIMFCGMLLGATYYQQRRAAERMELEFVALQQRVMEQAADQRSALELRIRSVDRVKENLGALQAELRANVDEFNRLMSASLRSLSDLGDSALADLQRQLLAQDGDVGEVMSGVRERATALERQLDEVNERLGVLTERLPDLDSGVDRMAERLEAASAGLERAESQVATLQAQAPELALLLEGQRQALAQDLESRRQAISRIDAEMSALQDALDGSRSQLAAFDDTLAQDLARAKQQSAELGRSLDQVRAAEQQAAEWLAQADGTTQAVVQERIEALLAELTDQSGLAIQRSQEVVQRAEAEAARRLESATEQVIAGLSKAQEAQLAELRTWAADVQAELERTRAELLAGWQGMDEAVAERQSQALAELDQYAATLEVRVQEFLTALDVIVARSSG